MGKKIELPIVNPDYNDPGPAKKDAEEQAPPAANAAEGDGPKPRSQGGDILSEIEFETTSNPVFLYMKGTPDFPQCGFSAQVAGILKQLDVEFASSNVLEDPEKRQGIKVYANWPTIPQLYVDGKFVGGCDIVTEMYQEGELQELLGLDS